MTSFSFNDLGLVAENYERFKKDPLSVEPSWRSFFEGWDLASSLPAAAAPSSDLRIYHLIEAYRTYGHYAAQVNPLAAKPPAEVPELALEKYGFGQDDLQKVFPTGGFLKKKEAPLGELVLALKQTPLSDFLAAPSKPFLSPYLDKLRTESSADGAMHVLTSSGSERTWLFRFIW